MALDKNFPTDPYVILNPEIRWFPGDEAYKDKAHQLVAPLVSQLRREVKAWRNSGYEGATKTSRILLDFWFNTNHLIPQANGETVEFKYYFAQREAIETIIWLYEVAKAHNKYDLMKFSARDDLQANMFDEDWTRYVVKMATGTGKTKILALALVWSYFHKLYEEDSALARNFLVIAPNVIVFERIKSDFEGLKVFFADPMLPDDGYMDHNWREDFNKIKVHLQDEVRVTHRIGNIFLTNIHRVYDSHNKVPSADDVNSMDYFLGPKPVGKTNESKIDVAQIVREIDELIVLNDEAHHIHDDKLAWFKSIQDIHNRMVQKGGQLPLQIDVTATPKKQSGAIFVQTICDYPLVEAIHQHVVKQPVLPDEASRAKIKEHPGKFVQQYQEFINLGYLEWKKVYDEQIKNNKKAILFVMTDDTRNCDDVAEYLESTYPDLKGKVLTIHTNNNGEISEATTGKTKSELEDLRKQANSIDSLENDKKAIVSVLMLKEGWDVRNVTTIVGLRAYSSKAKILPEQTLGRGLRLMYPGQLVAEKVSVIGTDAFMEFVEQIKSEGVELEYKRMGKGTEPKAPPVIGVDEDDKTKDIEKLDIEIPVLTPRITREYKNLSELDLIKFSFKPVKIKQYSESEIKEIIFRHIINDEESHRTEIKQVVTDATSAVGFFAQHIKSDLRLVSGYDLLYGKVKIFIRDYLFGEKVNLEDANILRNLSETEVRRTIIEEFKKQVNQLTVVDRGEAEIANHIKISNTKSFVVKQQDVLAPKKSVFNRIIGDSHFELEFAAFLDKSDDIISFAKNYMAIGFKLEYQNAKGEISNYFPDFLVKTKQNELWVIETKGLEDVDVEPKRKRLKQWVKDVNQQQDRIKVNELFVSQEQYEKYRPTNFTELVKILS
ncbi:MAG: DEAD/DEAH box helicase family protein [bacterium]|nr:DEAD/DEAH box helicase family protein [bacterium]